MNDKGLIITGLVVFLVVVTFPIWYTAAAGGAGVQPQPVLPADESACIEDKAYMIANHMQMLKDWRTQVVREGKRVYTSMATGKEYEMSLTKTCLGCHQDRQKFCYECHRYANVQTCRPRDESTTGQKAGIHCWNCHLEPKGN